MLKLARKLTRFCLEKLDLYSSYALRHSGAIGQDGWFRSYREQAAVDAAGHPLPWITYPAIAFLEKRVQPEMTVFEYGCGNSTRWWAGRVARVVSCEHDAAWHQKVLPTLPENVELRFVPLAYDGDYCRQVTRCDETFDIVVIDGRDRVNCAKQAVQALKPNGVILWDNSDREAYAEGYAFLQANGFKKVEFTGLSPISLARNETGIFYRPDNVLGL
ncbi:hypothetical protein D3C86_1348310 [compost metagenome]